MRKLRLLLLLVAASSLVSCAGGGSDQARYEVIGVGVPGLMVPRDEQGGSRYTGGSAATEPPYHYFIKLDRWTGKTWRLVGEKWIEIETAPNEKAQ